MNAENPDPRIEPRRKPRNIAKIKPNITRLHHEQANGHKAAILWFTGLAGSGKSSLARQVEKNLYSMGFHTMLLDGVNIRGGLCNDLGFSARDRDENIRRAGETAKLFFEQGNIVCCSFISPLKSHRQFVRSLTPKSRFLEIFVKCPIEVCIKRDSKGLYKEAIENKIPDFTGISAPYENPLRPELVIDTVKVPLRKNIQNILQALRKRKIIRG